MFSDDTRKKLENIIRGILIEGTEDNCTAARNFLCSGFSTSTTVKRDFEGQLLIKEKQAGRLRDYATENRLWVDTIPRKTQFILHNLIFTDTAYEFLGFTEIDNTLFAVVEQPFIVADGQADLNDIRAFLKYNGFENTRRQDYFNKEYGLILEDMHDENVILKADKLFFIDTVFYTVSI